MTDSKKNRPLTNTEKKRLQRERIRLEGLTEYLVIIPDTPEAKEKLRLLALKLTKQHRKERAL